ncbi:GtrA family protein [Niabella insulamsoli]|uniref:GtrA family protein n=1 Tax=Niabella insulamsoli TaxID=3144874 RepID=UPI0031FD766A
MPLQTFRYAVSGAANTVFGLLVFYIAYHFILGAEDLNLGFYAFESYTVSLIISFTAAFFLGFFLMKYVVFDDSRIRGHVQMFRYFLVCLFNLVLNYVLLKLAVEVLGIYPTFAQLATTIVVVIISYLAQRHFTFKKGTLPDYVEEENDAAT